MSVLTYPPTNDEEIFRHCTKECGIITSTEDQQYFALLCMTCSEKFLYFDSFIEHMQTMHASYNSDGSNALASSGGDVLGRNKNNGEKNKLKRRLESDSEEDLTALLQPSVVMIKEEKIAADDDEDNGAVIQNEPLANDDGDDYAEGYYSVKQEQTAVDVGMDLGDSSYMGDSYGSYNDDYVGDDDDLDQSNNGDDANYDDLVEESLLERNSRKMSSDQDSKQKLKTPTGKVKPKCLCCGKLSRKLDLYAGATQKQYKNLIKILAEHRVLMDRVLNRNPPVTNLTATFPINTEEQLKEFDATLVTQRDPYTLQIKTLLDGNAERNLHQIFGQGIIMNFNIDGSFGKRRLRDFVNVFAAMMDVISTFSTSSEKTLRAAFQRQKKKFFKQSSRNNTKIIEQCQNEVVSFE